MLDGKSGRLACGLSLGRELVCLDHAGSTTTFQREEKEKVNLLVDWISGRQDRFDSILLWVFLFFLHTRLSKIKEEILASGRLCLISRHDEWLLGNPGKPFPLHFSQQHGARGTVVLRLS